MLKVISATPSPYARKVRIALIEKAIPFGLLTDVPWNDDTIVRGHNPLEKLPILVTEHDGDIYDSALILDYLDLTHPQRPLIPAEPKQRIAAKQVEVLQNGVCDAVILIFFERQRPPAAQSAAWIARQQRKIERGIAEVARLAGGKPFIVGDSFTIADICAGAMLGYISLRYPELDWRTQHPALAGYFETLSQRESFASTVPSVQAISARRLARAGACSGRSCACEMRKNTIGQCPGPVIASSQRSLPMRGNVAVSAPDPVRQTGLDVRLMCRSGSFAGPTTGLAPGYVQGNLAILPRDWADEFLRFCQANPKPCPVLGVSERGNPAIPALGDDLDIRTDLPRYRVWRDGKLIDEPRDLQSVWRDDLVSFVIGCSFSFEEALLEADVPVRHIARGTNVAMYRTSIATRPAGRFHGPMVVSMRPFKPADAIRAVQITARLPAVHGAPVHLGFPDAIGITDIGKPDYGDATPVEADELPVFWACGVTPQAAIAAARPPFAITHAPGAMLVTDLKNHQLTLG